MKILLVTSAKKLEEKFAALNPELEYCAIVTDDVKSAKKFLESTGLSEVPLYPMKNLKKCLENLDYDYIVPVQEQIYSAEIMQELSKYNAPKRKVISFAALNHEINFMTECRLRYYKEHAQEFEIFVTGISGAYYGVDVSQFKRKTINLAKPSQDLYYDFQIAKTVLSVDNRIRYALINLAPHSFHYDLSQVFRYRCIFLNYFTAFNDLHNFFMPVDVYKNFFSEKYLARKLPIDNLDPNGGKSEKIMNQQDIEAPVAGWRGKYYPKTRDENIKILDDYLTLCEENNIIPIMFRAINSERYMAEYDETLLEEFDRLVCMACLNHPSAIFINGWHLKGFTYDDFWDHIHLNVQGAKKFSAYLNDFIEKLER